MADDKVIQLTPSVSMELVEAAQSTKARAETGAVPVGLGDGFIVPSRFRCFIETDNVPGLEVGLRVVVADDGTPTCVEFMLRQTDEQEPTPITWETLRNISLAQLLKVAGGAAMEKGEYREGQFVRAPMTTEDVEDVRGRFVSRRVPVASRNLEQVAAIYREARAAGLPPTKTVAERMYRSRSTASRLVKEARDNGLLGGTRGQDPRGGEQ